MKDGITYEVMNGIGVLRVDRPQARNALDWAAQEAFARVVAEAAADNSLRTLIVTGTGTTFVAGGDLKQLAAHPEPAAAERLHRVMSEALAGLTALPVPVLAAINGDAVGGGWEILTACDLRLMAVDARLRFAQVQVGLTTGWGGAGRLVRLIGQSRALELLLGARSLSAQEAQAIGLVHRVVPAGEPVLDAAQQWAHRLAALPADALASMKKLVYAAAERPSPALSAYERRLFVDLWGSANHQEAVTAFLEKRRPQFNLDIGNTGIEKEETDM